MFPNTKHAYSTVHSKSVWHWATKAEVKRKSDGNRGKTRVN